MAKTPAPIRIGFEYQDFYCAQRLLEQVKAGSLDTVFQIDADDVHHVDDLVIRPPNGIPTGHQVKYHVDQSQSESFNSLAESRFHTSLLHKLYRGWCELSEDGEQECQLRYVSLYPADTAHADLGAAISGKNRRFRDTFYSDPKFATARATWTNALQISPHELAPFVRSLQWHLAQWSLDDLRENTIDLLQQLKLPSHETALMVVREVISYFATLSPGYVPVTEFLRKLWETHIFREACEQQFHGITFTANERPRATQVRVAVISISTLAAFVGERFAPLEEPAPLADYSTGVTIGTLGPLIDQKRQAWLDTYQAWLRLRIDCVLTFLQDNPPDLVVFPRYSLPPFVAERVFAWAMEHRVNVSLGAHSIIGQTGGLQGYVQHFNVRLFPGTAVETVNTIADTLVRHDRSGRCLVSSTTNPAAREAFEGEIPLFDITCRDGSIVRVAQVPTSSTVHRFLEQRKEIPELLVSSAGEHCDEVLRALQNSAPLKGVALALTSNRQTVLPFVDVVKPGKALPTSNEWEGITICDVRYDRGPTGYTVRVSSCEHVPIVYCDTLPPPNSGDRSEWRASLRGLVGTLATAQMPTCTKVIVCPNVDDPDRFFLSRVNDATDALKQSFQTYSSELVVDAGARLKVLEEVHNALAARTQLRPTQIAPKPSNAVTTPTQVAVVDRAEEAGDIGRFIEGSEDRRVLFIFGPPGIGKKAVIEHVRSYDVASDRWQDITVPADSSFHEFISIVRRAFGGTELAATEQLDSGLYADICRRVSESNCKVLIVYSAENLPLQPDDPQHAELLAFLSVVCRSRHSPVPRIVLVSRSNANFNFKNSHLLQRLHVDGLDEDNSLQLLHGLLRMLPRTLARPTIGQLQELARRVHGYPIVAKIAVSLLDHLTADEIIDSLHSQKEIRSYIVGELLGRSVLSVVEESILTFAAMFRTPVDMSAFAAIAGGKARSLVHELTSKLILQSQNQLISLHPLVREHFKAQVDDPGEIRTLHGKAFDYFERLWRSRQLSPDEMRERVYHALRSGIKVHPSELRGIVSPARSTIIDALRVSDYRCVDLASDAILDIMPDDAMARVCKAIALDADGKKGEAEQYIDSVHQLNRRDLWIAIRFAANRIRERDFDFAEQLLSDLQTRHGITSQLNAEWAHFYDRKGLVDKSLYHCRQVLEDNYVHPADAFRVAQILRSADRLEIFIDYVERTGQGMPSDFRLRRVYGYACVKTNHDPDGGLQILSDMYRASSRDPHVIADYAAALAFDKRSGDAEAIFKRGVRNGGSRRVRIPIVDEYARFLDFRGDHEKAHPLYEDLLRTRSYDLYIYRRYSRSLHEAARQAHNEKNYSKEESLNRKAQQVLKTLLEMAPDDEWAAGFLETVESRVYPTSP